MNAETSAATAQQLSQLAVVEQGFPAAGGSAPLIDVIVNAAAAACNKSMAWLATTDGEQNVFNTACGMAAADALWINDVVEPGQLKARRLYVVADTRTGRGESPPYFAAEIRLSDGCEVQAVGVPSSARDKSIRSYAVAALESVDGELLGVLGVADRRAGGLTPKQQNAFLRVADAATHALRAQALDFADTMVDEISAFAEFESTQRELILSRDRLHSVLEGAEVGTWEWQAQTGEVHFNERWAAIIGYTLEELEPISFATWSGQLHPDDFMRAIEELERHMTGETPFFECEVRMRHKSGDWIWANFKGRVVDRDEHGEPRWITGTSTDVTSRKRAEQVLRDSQRMLERTGQIANVGGWQFDLRSEELTWSRQMFHIYDLDETEPASFEKGMSCYRGKSRDAISAALDNAIEHGEPWDLELPIRTANGRDAWVRVSGEVEFDAESGEPMRLFGALQDITERQRSELELEQSRELLQVTLESIGDAVITTDVSGKVRWMNSVAERLTGWTTRAAEQRRLDDVFCLVDQDSDQRVENPAIRCFSTAEVVRSPDNISLVAADGTRHAVQITASPILDSKRAMLGVILAFQDVSEQRRLSREMTYRATHDILTGLNNRTEFENALQRVIERINYDGSENALMYIDLDQFKIVNDSCGHGVGDQLIRQISSILRGCVRQKDIVARLGGDEFGIMLEHCTVEQGQRVAQKICDQVDEYRLMHEGKSYRVGTSIGLVPVDRNSITAAAVLQAADAACYAAKEAGRNRVQVWREKDQMIRARQGEMQWASRIEQALDRDRFELHAQRIIPINKRSSGFHAEILIRMHGDNDELIGPGAFLPAAERYSLASRIDRWVVNEVFCWLSHPDTRIDLIDTIAINLSGQSMGDRAFHAYLIELIENASFDVGKLCLEITETAVITHIEDAGHFIASIRDHGIRVALDDFGAGASSFGYLKSLPVNYLKIDGQFIRDLTEDPLDLATVRCFTEVAQVVGIETIAEFVDNEATVDKLRELGVDYAQGFLLHKPEPLTEVLR